MRPARTKKKSKGRRNIRELDIPEERVEILDSALEGKAERIGFEESCFLGRRRGGTFRVVMARATYKITADGETTTFVTADKPKEIYERGILAPSFIAHLLTKKFRWGMPFHRIALELASDFFVVLADKDHVFFEYQPKHTSDAVCSMFRGFSWAASAVL